MKESQAQRKKAKGVPTYEEMMYEAHNDYVGKEAKLRNIIAKHGSAPAEVWREADEAEAKYGFLKALWKEDERERGLR